MTMSKVSLGKIFIPIAILSSIHIYGLYHIFLKRGDDLFNVLFYGIVFLTIIFSRHSVSLNFNINKRFRSVSFSIFYLYIALVFSSISCLYFHGQNPLLGMLASRFFALYLLFFILCFYAPSKKYILKLIFLFALGYVLVFSIQLLIYPIQIVPFGSVEGFDRGLLRVRVEGVGFLTFGGLLALNHYLRYKKLLFLVLFSIVVIYLFLLGFRTLIAIYLFSTLYLIYTVNKKNIKKIFFSIVMLGIIAIITLLSGVMDEYYQIAKERTIQQIEMGDKYIRFRTFSFLFDDVSPGWEALIFGNGIASESTSYGQLVLNTGANKLGYIVADIGLIGYVFYFGFFGFTAFILLYLKVIFSTDGEITVVVKAFFIYLILSSFTTAEIFRAGMFGVSMIALYLYVLEGKKNEKR